MKRATLLDHIKRTRFAPGDREKALADAAKIAGFLKREYSAEVIGVGSLFESPRPFRADSDIDLVVRGLPAKHYITACVQAEKLSTFEINLIPWETANDLMLHIAQSRGKRLYISFAALSMRVRSPVGRIF